MWLDDDGGMSGYGPSTDGTYSIPTSAQPVNLPSNTAGFPSFTGQDALDVLKYGVGVISDSWKFSELLDYKRFEATKGGVYQQGQYANGAAVRFSGSNPLLMAGVLLLGFLYFTRKA